jgi:hypothetical protein
MILDLDLVDGILTIIIVLLISVMKMLCKVDGHKSVMCKLLNNGTETRVLT